MIPAGLRRVWVRFVAPAAAAAILFQAAAWGAVAAVPFFDDFDYPVLGPWWTASGLETDAPAWLPAEPDKWWCRLLDTCGPPSGAYHLVLDSCVAGTGKYNEVTLTVDLAGRSSVFLEFQAKSFADTPHPLLPWEPYTGSKNFDGVVVSPDGVTWYPLVNLAEGYGLTRSYTQFKVSLDAALDVWKIGYTSAFRIRFNHYGDGQVVSVSGNSGLGIDAVRVSELPPLIRNFGGAPAPYPTLLSDNGARHLAVGPKLGAARVVTADGNPTDDASGGNADDDGVVFVEPLVPGQSATLRVTASAPAKLDAWMDFNLNGSWADAEDRALHGTTLAAGENDVVVSIPADAEVSDRVFARFRLSTAGGLSPDGPAPDGEVEDYRMAVVPNAPLMNPEPALSPGTTNTVSWVPVAQADTYYAECSKTADFSIPFQASGWIPFSRQEFIGLSDVAQYFRVRASRSLPGAEASWSQMSDAEFSMDTRSGTALYGGGRVSLQGPTVHTDTVGGAREDLKKTSTGAGRFNVFLVSHATRLTGFSMFMSRESATNVEFAVYEGGAAFPNPSEDPLTDPLKEKVYSETVRVDAGIGFVSTGGMSLLLSPGKHYALGMSSSGAVNTYMGPTSANPSFGTNGGRAASVTYPGEAPLSMAFPRDAYTLLYHMRVTTIDASAYSSSGEIISPVIRPASWFAWRALNYTAETPDGTAVTVDVLPESGNSPVSGWSGLAPGRDLSLLTVMPMRLRARLSTTNTAVSPALLDWGVTWQSAADRRVEGPWSAPVMSTQDGQAPFVAAVTRSGPNPARTPTVRFLVQYSEAVTGVRLAAPFSDFALRPGSVPGASIVSVTQETGDPSRYDVEVTTRNTGGTVAIDALTDGAIRDLPGNPLSKGDATGAAYTLDYTPPTVTGITLLDPSPTNAPTVRFAVTFSEAVTGVPSTAPFAGFGITGITGTRVSSMVGGGAAYTVSVLTGELDGSIGLALNPGGAMRDAAGWPVADGWVSSSKYQMSHLRFTAVPASLTRVKAGIPYSMSVAATGGMGARKHQWYFYDAVLGWSALPDAVGPTLDIAQVAMEDDGLYYCEVTDAHETIESPPARLELLIFLPVAGCASLVLAAAALAVAGARRIGGRPSLSRKPRRS